jgi:hypothetical protein
MGSTDEDEEEDGGEAATVATTAKKWTVVANCHIFLLSGRIHINDDDGDGVFGHGEEGGFRCEREEDSSEEEDELGEGTEEGGVEGKK